MITEQGQPFGQGRLHTDRPEECVGCVGHSHLAWQGGAMPAQSCRVGSKARVLEVGVQGEMPGETPGRDTKADTWPLLVDRVGLTFGVASAGAGRT